MLGRSGGRWHRRWLVLGRWASGDGDIHRTSVRGQAGRDGRVDVDTFIAPRSRPLDGYRLRVTLYRRQGSTATPSLSMIGAMTSALAPTRNVPAGGRPHGARSIELPVPRYSQSIHAGEYPEYDNGGAAWCSPTSTQMVIEYWGRGPTSQDLAWVNPRFRDPQVDHAARMTYDFGYRGAGNWPFNTAYAAGYGLRAQVTRLRSLGELERFVARRIPVVTSVAFRRDELPGAGYGTNGHLMVVVGFTRKGDVIANDPAAPTNAAVRHVYPRRRFETVWLRTRRVRAGGAVAAANGGIVYLIRPPDVALPPRTGRTGNW
jgi:peptidase C39-like protein